MSTLADVLVNIIASTLFFALGLFIRTTYGWYRSRTRYSIWWPFRSEQAVGLLMSVRPGPLPRSTERTSLTEARVIVDTLPILEKIGIKARLLDATNIDQRQLGTMNLILIGGPGSNPVSKDFVDSLQPRLPVKIAVTPPSIDVSVRSYIPQYDQSTTKVAEDYGVLIFDKNPFDTEKLHFVMMIMGLHGFGTEGAAKALRDKELVHELKQRSKGNSFVAITHSKVVGNDYITSIKEVYLLT